MHVLIKRDKRRTNDSSAIQTQFSKLVPQKITHITLLILIEKTKSPKPKNPLDNVKSNILKKRMSNNGSVPPISEEPLTYSRLIKWTIALSNSFN